MFLSKERRRTLALYMLARLAQCLYNSLKQRGLFHFWGSDWAYGDALLFALSSAQVLPKSPLPVLLMPTSQQLGQHCDTLRA